VLSVETLGLLTLDGLVKFGGSELADLMAEVFDLGPSQVHRRTLFAIGLGTDHSPQLLHLLEDLG
jgi:hypothetical protein